MPALPSRDCAYPHNLICMGCGEGSRNPWDNYLTGSGLPFFRQHLQVSRFSCVGIHAARTGPHRAHGCTGPLASCHGRIRYGRDWYGLSVAQRIRQVLLKNPIELGLSLNL